MFAHKTLTVTKFVTHYQL